MSPTTPTTLYRVYDSRGELLYVGISGSVLARWGQHADDKEWWPSNGSARFERFAYRELALAAERRAIREENPRFNIQGQPWFLSTDEDDVVSALFGFPENREPDCSFSVVGLAFTIGWAVRRFRRALARLQAEGRIALDQTTDGIAHALLLEPASPEG